MVYCSVQEVYDGTSLTTNEVPSGTIAQFLEPIARDIDRLSFTTWWNFTQTGTATSATSSTLTNTAAPFGANQALKNYYVYIKSGEGQGQIRQIVSHTTSVLTIDEDWTDVPDATSVYEIYGIGSDPRKEEIFELNNPFGNTNPYTEHYVEQYPIVSLDEVKIDNVSVTPSEVFIYPNDGRLVLKTTAEKNRWIIKPQGNQIKYLFGVKKRVLDPIVKRMAIVGAAMMALNAQIGGTHNIPSTISLPEGSVSIGQAYINIKGAKDEFNKEYESLKTLLPKFYYIG